MIDAQRWWPDRVRPTDADLERELYEAAIEDIKRRLRSLEARVEAVERREPPSEDRA